MSNTELEKDADGQSHLTVGLAALAAEWQADGGFLDNGHDHPSDRASGQTYKLCAKELLAVMAANDKLSEAREKNE